MGLGEKLREVLRRFAGKVVVDEEAVKELIRNLQRVMIANDVDVKLVLKLSKDIEKRVKEEEPKGVTLKQHVLRIVYEELVKLMGESYKPSLGKKRIMLVGLYGSGKTTTAGKLAYYYKSKGLSVALVAADFDRPAAIEQLKQLAQSAKVKFYAFGKTAEESVKEALKLAKEDVIIIDTAGRSAFNEELKEELQAIYKLSKPDEVIAVISADAGKIAKKHAEAFNDAVKLTGVIVTRAEGSGKGGAALSAVASLGIPIMFIGTGEKLKDLEEFDAKKFVGKLLGIPDFKGFLDKIKEKQKEFELKEEMDLEAFMQQLRALKSMGPLSSVMANLGLTDMPKDMLRKGEEELKAFEAIINSMTKEERRKPELLKDASRIKRIAKGSGVDELTVRRFLNQFFTMKKLMKRMKGRNQRDIAKLLKGFKHGKVFIR